tara:strand:+ start:601 stop:864 length:264 start_codon:yes stop_codon:yes gene_type:complete
MSRELLKNNLREKVIDLDIDIQVQKSLAEQLEGIKVPASGNRLVDLNVEAKITDLVIKTKRHIIDLIDLRIEALKELLEIVEDEEAA